MPCYRRVLGQVTSNGASLLVKGGDQKKGLRLEGSAWRIWELLEYPTDLNQLAQTLAAEFAADPDAIARDTAELIAALEARGLADEVAAPAPDDLHRTRYLSLLKRALVNLLYPEHELRLDLLNGAYHEPDPLERTRYIRDIRYREPLRHQRLTAAKLAAGHTGEFIYGFPHTMIGMAALDNIERCAERVFDEGVQGDFFEAGVCQGGAAIFLRALQLAYGEGHRQTWLADSFAGLPTCHSAPDIAAGIDWSEASRPQFAFSEEGVRDNFIRYDLLDDRVRFLPGWFSESLPGAEVGPLAILRVDADLYESTRDVLRHLYAKVSPGGFVIVDDYGFLPPCRQAVEEFRAEHRITEPLTYVNHSCVYWRKT
jgi:hypothetical protein